VVVCDRELDASLRLDVALPGLFSRLKHGGTKCWDKRPRAIYPEHVGGLRDVEVWKCMRTTVMLRNNYSSGVTSMRT
jgi:hypothetical protein